MLYTHNGNFEQPINIISMVKRVAKGVNSGPVPCLLAEQNVIQVPQQKDHTIILSTNSICAKAIPLLTCAAVIYASANPNDKPVAYIQHILSGLLSEQDIANSLSALETKNEKDVCIIYAHPNASDSGYSEAIHLLEQRFDPNKIVEIEKLTACSFGINNLGMIGV
jgi:hypothetical protein